MLYEMLSGKRPFAGDDVADTLAAVLRADPDWLAIPNTVPSAVDAVLRRCLQRDRKRRISDLSTVVFVLDEPGTLGQTRSRDGESRRRVLLGTAISVVVALLIGAAILGWIRTSSSRPIPVRFAVLLPEGQRWTPTASRPLAISPDGANIVYAANQQLYLRNISDLAARLIQGTAASADTPFFSPDGKWLGFFAASERKLKKIAVSGGASLAICDADAVNGASWSTDDRIYFADQTGIRRVIASGGKAETIISRQAGEVLDSPQVLPDGRTLLFTVALARSANAYDRARIVTQRVGFRRANCHLGRRERRTLPANAASHLRTWHHVDRRRVRSGQIEDAGWASAHH